VSLVLQPDPVADVAPKINAALANGGQAALTGPGNHRAVTPITIPANAMLEIEGGTVLNCPADTSTPNIVVREGFLVGAGRIVGPGISKGIGKPNCQAAMGVWADDHATVRDLRVSGFLVGADIVGNHQHFDNVRITDCYINLTFGAGADDFGDQHLHNCDLTGAYLASIAVDPSSTIDNAEFIGGHAGWAPYGILRPSTPGSTAGKQFITSTVFKGFAFETVGNAAIYDQSGTKEVSSCVFENAGGIFNPAWRMSGAPRDGLIDVGTLMDVRFTGSATFSTPGDKAVVVAHRGAANVIWEDGRAFWQAAKAPAILSTPSAKGVYVVGPDGRYYTTDLARTTR
jgi:hypothetical protein